MPTPDSHGPAHGTVRGAAQRPARALPQPPVAGNRVELLAGSVALQAALFDAVDRARDHVNLEAGSVHAGSLAAALIDRLAARRRPGVKVNLLFDGFGPPLQRPGAAQGRLPDRAQDAARQADLADRLRAAGVQLCRRAAPARHGAHQLIVVDGRVAFAAGASAAAREAGAGAAARPWRDVPLRLQGPVVAQLQQRFIAQWQAHSGLRPRLAHYFPSLPVAGVQSVALAPATAGDARLADTLLQALAQAHDRVCLAAATLPARLQRALCDAAQRGVDVVLVLPGAQAPLRALHAGRARYARLLDAGVRVHELQPTRMGTCVALVDRTWAGLCWAASSAAHGVAAPDLVVLDPTLAAQLEATFADDLARSRPIHPADWQHRGLRQRSLEWLARLL